MKILPPGFPKTAEDGSFEVRVRFSGTPKCGLPPVHAWLTTWVEQNAEWDAFGETHWLSEYFREEPRVELSHKGELSVRLRGVNSSKRFWKDWYVRICRSLQDEFPDVGDLVAVENA